MLYFTMGKSHSQSEQPFTSAWKKNLPQTGTQKETSYVSSIHAW